MPRFYYPDDSPYLLWLDRPEPQAEQNLTVLAGKTSLIERRSETRGLRQRTTKSPLTPSETEGVVAAEDPEA
jgi:hypothetical protein